MTDVDLLVHPVRLRIVHALSGDRALTTGQLCARLPDVSKATMYRQVDLLAGAGILEVEGEHRVRGAVERRYRLRRGQAAIGAEVTAAAGLDDYRRAFSVAMAALLAEFGAYLDRPGADPVADLVGFRQHTVWLSPAELIELIGELRAVLAPRLSREPAPGRAPYLISPIQFPLEPPQAEAAEA